MATTAELDREFRRIQLTSSSSFSVVLPKHFVTELGLAAGRYVKCAKDGRRIVIEPVEDGR
jgi:antitoxin component of MazEF toxin-antitoxin module